MSRAGILHKFIKGALNAKLELNCCPPQWNFPFRSIYLPRLIGVERNVSVNCLAYYYSSGTIQTKVFPHYENEKCHDAMENMPGYKDVAPCPTLDDFRNMAVKYWGYSESKVPSNVCETFVATTIENVKDRLTLEDSRFHDLVNSIVRQIPMASNDQLLQILIGLNVWPPSTTDRYTMFKMLWNALDKQCVRRMKNLTPSYKLLIADYWFHLRISRLTKYNPLMIKDLIESKDDLSVPQLVQLMFYVNVQRDTPQSLLKFLEDKLENVIKDINLQELGIICLGFFKTQNRIVSKRFVKSVLIRLISEVPTGDPFAVSCCFKFLRKSMHGDLKDLYVSLIHQSVKHISKFEVPGVIHMMLLSYGINIYVPSVLDAAMDRLVEEKSAIRSKDAMKLLHCLAHFNHQPKPEFDKCVQNVFTEEKYREEIASYPRILVYVLLSYAYLGYYPLGLIEKALHPEFVNRCIRLHGVDMMNPIAVLNYCVEIECDNYCGPKVDQSFLKILQNEKGNVPQSRGSKSFQARFLDLTFQLLCEICGDSRDICIKHVLPHMYSPDIILRLNSKDRLPLSSFLEPLENCLIKPPPDELWVCVMACGGYCFAYGSKRLTGINSMKRRHLVKLGYKVLFVPFYEGESKSQLKKYLTKNLGLLKNNIVDEKHALLK